MVACRPTSSRLAAFLSAVAFLDMSCPFISHGAAVNPPYLLPTGNASSSHGTLTISPDISSTTTAGYRWFSNHHGNYAGIYFASSRRDLCETVVEVNLKTFSRLRDHDNHSQTEEIRPCSGSDVASNVGFLVTFGSSLGFQLNFRLRPNRGEESSSTHAQIFWMAWSNDDNVTCDGVLCAAPEDLRDEGYVCIDSDWMCDMKHLGKCAQALTCDDEVDGDLPTMTILKYFGVGVAVIVVFMCCIFCVRTGVQDIGEHGGHTLGMFSIVWVRNSLIGGAETRKDSRNKAPAAGVKRDSFNRASFKTARFNFDESAQGM